jgi:two-component system sensor histidine kinase FlrB
MLIFAKGDVSESEYMDTGEFFSQLKALLEPDYKSQQISLKLNSKLDEVSIRANMDALLSAMQNLVDNAVAACDTVESKTEIAITALLNSENKFEINIKDNGCGMSQQTLERVLEPFFTTRTNGTGLGLAVVNTTINRYNGQLRIDSQPGKGSNFNIQFPRAKSNGLLHSNLNAIDINKQTIQAGTKVTGKQEVIL